MRPQHEVEIHPDRHLVKAGVEACISIRRRKPRARVYNMGTVCLYGARFVIHPSGLARAQAEQVRNVHAWAVGRLVDEYIYRHDVPEGRLRNRVVKVTYHFQTGRFLTVDADPDKVVDVTDGTFAVLWATGPDFWITKEW